MKLSKLALAAISATALLVGCAANNGQVTLQKSDQVSQARVIGSYFGYKKIKDSEIPKDKYVARESFLYNLVDHTSALSVPNVGMGGVHGWSGFGVGLGLSLLQGFLAPEAYEMLPGAFGFVPVQYAKTKEEARDYWFKTMKQSLIEANKRWNQGYKLKFYTADGSNEDIPVEIVYFINPEKGCPANEEVRNIYKTCRMDLRVMAQNSDTPQVIPSAFTNGKVINGWKVNNFAMYYETKRTNISWIISKDSQFNRDDLYKHWMKTLPQYSYVYSEPHKDLKGEKVPPYIIERNKSHFWVIPAKETKSTKK